MARTATAETLTETDEQETPRLQLAPAAEEKKRRGGRPKGAKGKGKMPTRRGRQARSKLEIPGVVMIDVPQLPPTERWDLLPWGASSKVVTALGDMQLPPGHQVPTLHDHLGALMRDVAAFGKQLRAPGGVLDNEAEAESHLARAAARIMVMLETGF